MTAARVAFLGPQRLRPTLADTLGALGLPVEATVATVTAGWQEREDEDRELAAELGERAVNLALYRRTERVFARDPDLAHAYRERQSDLRTLQSLYRIRLFHAMSACRELLRKEGNGSLLDEERERAVEAVRELDRQHLEQVRARHRAFDRRWRPARRAALARERAEVASIVAGAAAVAVAGGHVAVLVNRLRLFSLERLVAGKLVVAWSAGAIALADTVVLFHDDPPHGEGYPEVLEAGLAAGPGVVPLPDARHRLRLGDPLRVGTFARRFAPAMCVPMDEGARVDWDGSRWTLPAGTRRLGVDGKVHTWVDA